MQRILDWVDQAERALQHQPDGIQAWIVRQQNDQTYVQRLASMIQRADLEKRPPPEELRSFLFRGQAYEVVSWPMNGYHPPGCVWFPTKEAWLLLRRSPVVPIIALPPWQPVVQDHGTTDLVDRTTYAHASKG